MLHELMTTAGHTLGALALGTVLPTDEGPGETRANFTLGDLNVDLTGAEFNPTNPAARDFARHKLDLKLAESLNGRLTEKADATLKHQLDRELQLITRRALSRALNRSHDLDDDKVTEEDIYEACSSTRRDLLAASEHKTKVRASLANLCLALVGVAMGIFLSVFVPSDYRDPKIALGASVILAIGSFWVYHAIRPSD